MAALFYDTRPSLCSYTLYLYDRDLHRRYEAAGSFQRVCNLLPGDVDEIAVVGVEPLRIQAIETDRQLRSERPQARGPRGLP